MSLHLAAEHFRLTPAIRTHVDGTIDKLRDVIPEDTDVSVFLSIPARKSFSALYKVHVDGQDVVCRRTGPDMYDAITQASQHVREMIFRERRKRIESKRSHHET